MNNQDKCVGVTGTQSAVNEASLTPKTTNLCFSAALWELKQGKKIRRAIWRGHWELAKNAQMEWIPNNNGYKRGCEFKGGIIIAVLKDMGGVAPATPYQEDLLAEDWMIVE